jgi:hypothetical protein
MLWLLLLGHMDRASHRLLVTWDCCLTTSSCQGVPFWDHHSRRQHVQQQHPLGTHLQQSRFTDMCEP